MRRRLIFISPSLVARIFAVAYAGFGFVGFLFFVFSDQKYYVLPFGLLGPLFHLNLNLSFSRPDYPLSFLFVCFAQVISYAVTGWLTGAAMVLCFNFIAKKMGGIDERYFAFCNDDDPAVELSQKSEMGIQQPGIVKDSISSND